MRRRLILITAAVLVVLAIATLAAPRTIESRFNRVLKLPPYSVSENAKRLHASLTVVDLHADSLLWGRDLRARGSTGHVDLPRLADANVALQAFTVVTQAPRNLNISSNRAGSDLVRWLAFADHWPSRTWNSRKERALYQAKRLEAVERGSSGSFMIVRSAEGVKRLLERRRNEAVIGGLLGAEGAQALDGDLANLDVLYAAGFRMMSPTHFTDTEIGGSASGASKGGLTDKGRAWVRRMEAKRMIIDLAHASPETIRDVTAIATRPVVVSHTGVKGTCNNNRNLSDEELRMIAKTDGVIGIGFWETAVCGRDADAIARAIRYAVHVVGVEHVALGSDFDGATTMPFDVGGLPQITDALLRAGLSERETRLIMGENSIRVLLQTLSPA